MRVTLKEAFAFRVNFIEGHSVVFFSSFFLSSENERREREAGVIIRSFSFIDIILIVNTDNMHQSTTFTKLLRVLQFRKHIKGKICLYKKKNESTKGIITSLWSSFSLHKLKCGIHVIF